MKLNYKEENKEEFLLLKYGIKTDEFKNDEKTGTCGGRITEFQTFESPGFERGAYFDNLTCTREIDLGEHVTGFRIVKEEFEVEHKNDCGYDFLKV